ncbi:hypothetical protein BLOT_000304 [Blomia tropicalis]|nr:hypothetical protein BLOT_000304 [Blomia tropicalis]
MNQVTSILNTLSSITTCQYIRKKIIHILRFISINNTTKSITKKNSYNIRTYCKELKIDA